MIYGEIGPCVEWSKAKNPRGYGMRWKDGVWGYAHRYAWEEANGPIPEGGMICHRCDNPSCYRLDHLFLGSALDNVRDMWAKGRAAAQQVTHCPAGHEYTPDNTWIGSTNRKCRACHLDQQRAWRAKRKAAANG